MTTAGYGTNLFIDVFRLGDYPYADLEQAGHAYVVYFQAITATDSSGNPSPDNSDAASFLSTYLEDLDTAVADGIKQGAVHIGRAVFDGRFSDLELNNAVTVASPLAETVSHWASLLSHAQSVYGPDAQPLLPLDRRRSGPTGEPSLIPRAGALATLPADPSQGSVQTLQLNFTSAGALEQNVGPLLNAAPVPFRVVGPDSDLNFDPSSYFFFQDNRRCYWVESQKYYWTGSFWSPVAPSDPSTAPYQVSYTFHPFYHPFTRLFWNQLAGGGFDLLYDPDLQQVPDIIDPSYPDVFSFQNGYQPTWRVQWDLADASTTLASSISVSQTAITVTNNIWVPLAGFLRLHRFRDSAGHCGRRH